MQDARHPTTQESNCVGSPSIPPATPTCDDPAKARDVMKSGVVTVPKNSSVHEAIAILVDKHISGLPVVDETGLVGIISEKDILRLLWDQESLSGSVEEYMTRQVTCVQEDDDLSAVCRCLVEHAFRRAPVTYEGKLTGIISRADLIRHFSRHFTPAGAPAPTPNRKGAALAKDVMTFGLLTLQPNAPIREAMDSLANRHVTGLPVVDDRMHLVGIVTEKDVLRCLYDTDVATLQAADIMSTDCVTFQEDSTLLDVCRCLIENGFRRVPILKDGRLTGIISRADIILYILKNKSAFFKTKAHQACAAP